MEFSVGEIFYVYCVARIFRQKNVRNLVVLKDFGGGTCLAFSNNKISGTKVGKSHWRILETSEAFRICTKKYRFKYKINWWLKKQLKKICKLVKTVGKNF